MNAIQLLPLADVPLIKPGDNLAAIIFNCLQKQGLALQVGDIVVVAQKIVSKSENRLVNLGQVTPSERAQQIAQIVNKDPRHVQVILDESNEVIWASPGIFVVEERNGYVAANAGVDRSNIEQPDGNAANHSDNEWVSLLPLDPDASAQKLRADLQRLTNVQIAVLINDTHGRPFRMGGVGVALGAAGLQTLVDERGESDLFGYKLQATLVATGDELASAASLLMGQAAEGTPVVIIRGYKSRSPQLDQPDKGAAELIRPKEQDKFRYPANRLIV